MNQNYYLKYGHTIFGSKVPHSFIFELIFEPDQKLLPALPNFVKICLCILEGRLTINPISSALHLQGLKSNTYVHFQLVNKQLVEI